MGRLLSPKTASSYLKTPGPDCRARSAEAGCAAHRPVLAEAVHHRDLELVGALALRIVIHGLVREAEEAANHS